MSCSSAKQSTRQTGPSLFPWDASQFRECCRINNLFDCCWCSVATRAAVVGELSGKLRLLFNVYEVWEARKGCFIIPLRLFFRLPSFRLSALESLSSSHLTWQRDLPSSFIIFIFFKLVEGRRKEQYTEARTRDSWKIGSSD